MKNKKTIKDRQSPGETGKGKYYHVEVRPSKSFIAFLTQDVGRKGGLIRVAGKRATGVWATVGWLVEKSLAHISRNGRLVIDNLRAKTMLRQVTQPILHKKGDIFVTKPRYSTPEDKRWSAMHSLVLGK